MTDQPASSDPRQLRASDADRERVAQVLNTAMSEGRITVAELDERLQAVYAAKTLGDLTPITSDLPGSQLTLGQPSTPATTGNAPAPATNRIGGTPTSNTAIAIMSGSDRKGQWVVPATFNAFAFWGGIEIDITEARFSEPEVTIQATTIMGGIDIVVPEDVTVHVTGVGFMGAFENKTRSQAPEGSPVVRVTGLALMGGVTVKNPRKRKNRELDA
ncbi:MAG: DUF1707 domain-containing protein [Pseudonocardiaceae bacterium]|nr:DUF1707 domain-containing protein [Pseudonocardiaceae bacterium]